MSRVFIIGAGFSKAVANTPLANKLFELILDRAINDRTETRRQWGRDRDCFLKIVNKLQAEAKPLIDALIQDGTEVETISKFPGLHPINIEYLCTILDLNIQKPYIPKGVGVDLKGCPIPFMSGLMVDDMKGARRFIQHYIVKLLLPGNISPNKDLLEKAVSFIHPGDTVISFNYDILVEQALWKLGLWNPIDGYRIGALDEEEIIEHNSIPETQVPVIKLHGSVNWISPDWEKSNLKILTTDIYTNEPIFEGLQVTSNRMVGSWNYPLHSHVVIPTFMKSFRYKWEFHLYTLASQAISDAKEIYIWGYSLPEADAIANLLFHHIKDNTKIFIIDPASPDNDSLENRLIMYHHIGQKNIIYEQNGIEKWVENGFKFKAYEEELNKKRQIQEMFGYFDEPNKT